MKKRFTKNDLRYTRRGRSPGPCEASVFKAPKADRFVLVRGQLIVEAMVAVVILSIATFSIFRLINTAIGSYQLVSDKYIANYLASEGVEWAKYKIDENIVKCDAWNKNLADGDYYPEYSESNTKTTDPGPLYINAGNFYSYGQTNATKTPFSRKVSIENLSDGNQIRIVSLITWKHGASQQVRLEGDFYNWRPTPYYCG